MIKLYALKINKGIAKDPLTGNPLIAPHTKEYKNKLKLLKQKISRQYPEYNKCKLIALRETIF